MDIKILGNGNPNHLINMLAWIEVLGSVGHSANFKVIVDGDGHCRWRFNFEDSALQKEYEILKGELVEHYINSDTDMECFEL